MTYSMTLLTGERAYIEFGGAWTRVQFKQPLRRRTPKRMSPYTHGAREHKKMRS